MSGFSGIPAIYGIKHLESGTEQLHQLGVIGFTTDGRKFRYAQVGSSTALVAGNLIQSQAEITGDQSVVVAAAAIGDTEVVTTGTVTVDANEYADGYLFATGEASTGTGNFYRIKSHPAASAAVVTLQLHDALVVAYTATTQIDLVHSPYKNVIQWPTSESASPIGIAPIATPASDFGWIQSGGISAALNAGGVAVGALVQASAGTAGAVETSTNALPTIGFAATGAASGEVGATYLLLD